MSAKVGSNSYEGAQKGAQSSPFAEVMAVLDARDRRERASQVRAEILRRRAKAKAIREQNERSKGKR